MLKLYDFVYLFESPNMLGFQYDALHCCWASNIHQGFHWSPSAEEISLGMFPSEHFHQIQEEVAVLLTVSLFIIIVIAPWSERTEGEPQKHGEGMET